MHELDSNQRESPEIRVFHGNEHPRTQAELSPSQAKRASQSERSSTWHRTATCPDPSTSRTTSTDSFDRSEVPTPDLSSQRIRSILANAQTMWSKNQSSANYPHEQPKIFLSKRTKNLVIKMPNGDIYEGGASLYPMFKIIESFCNYFVDENVV